MKWQQPVKAAGVECALGGVVRCANHGRWIGLGWAWRGRPAGRPAWWAWLQGRRRASWARRRMGMSPPLQGHGRRFLTRCPRWGVRGWCTRGQPSRHGPARWGVQGTLRPGPAVAPRPCEVGGAGTLRPGPTAAPRPCEVARGDGAWRAHLSPARHGAISPLPEGPEEPTVAESAHAEVTGLAAGLEGRWSGKGGCPGNASP